MSITTSQQLNGDQVQAQLPPGSSITATGGLLTSTDPKTITAFQTDDATLQAAITAAAAAYVDYGANLASLLQKAQTALANNQTYLAIGGPTNAQVVAQVQALTRQVDALIRVAVGNLASTAGT
jgi:hypothetical protein